MPKTPAGMAASSDTGSGYCRGHPSTSQSWPGVSESCRYRSHARLHVHPPPATITASKELRTPVLLGNAYCKHARYAACSTPARYTCTHAGGDPGSATLYRISKPGTAQISVSGTNSMGRWSHYAIPNNDVIYWVLVPAVRGGAL